MYVSDTVWPTTDCDRKGDFEWKISITRCSFSLDPMYPLLLISHHTNQRKHCGLGQKILNECGMGFRRLSGIWPWLICLILMKWHIASFLFQVNWRSPPIWTLASLLSTVSNQVTVTYIVVWVIQFICQFSSYPVFDIFCHHLDVYLYSFIHLFAVIQARHLSSKSKPLCDSFVKVSLLRNFNILPYLNALNSYLIVYILKSKNEQVKLNYSLYLSSRVPLC